MSSSSLKIGAIEKGSPFQCIRAPADLHAWRSHRRDIGSKPRGEPCKKNAPLPFFNSMMYCMLIHISPFSFQHRDPPFSVRAIVSPLPIATTTTLVINKLIINAMAPNKHETTLTQYYRDEDRFASVASEGSVTTRP